MKQDKNPKLITKIALLVILTIVSFAPALKATSYFPVRVQSESELAEYDPTVNTTLLVNIDGSGPNKWLKEQLDPETIMVKKKFKVDGQPAIFFDTVYNDQQQLGIAFNFTEDLGVIRLTNNSDSSKSELVTEAKVFLSLRGLTKGLETLATAEDCAKQNLCNCVLYARCFVPSLPTGMSTFAEKKSKINHYFPRVGSVAIIAVIDPKTGSDNDTGHCAVVTNVAINFDGSLRVYIKEAHFPECKETFRDGTPEALRIVGYFDPTYPSGQSAPKVNTPTAAQGRAGFPFTVNITGQGFDPATCQALIFGGSYCNAWGRCSVPNGNLQNKSTTTVGVPLLMNSPGTYYLYIFNQSSGKTSNGVRLTVQ